MGQVPSLQAAISMDGTPGSSSIMQVLLSAFPYPAPCFLLSLQISEFWSIMILQPPSFFSPHPRPKRCATHCYIAQNIVYHQRLAKMNAFWPAAAGSTPQIYGAKPYNLNAVPAADAFVAGGFAGRNAGSLQDNKGAATVSALPGPPSKEMMPSAKNGTAEAAQRKQLGHQQPPQPVSAANAPVSLLPSCFLYFTLYLWDREINYSLFLSPSFLFSAWPCTHFPCQPAAACCSCPIWCVKSYSRATIFWCLFFSSDELGYWWTGSTHELKLCWLAPE